MEADSVVTNQARPQRLIAPNAHTSFSIGIANLFLFPVQPIPDREARNNFPYTQLSHPYFILASNKQWRLNEL